jgi:hypothetical protein
MICTPGTPGELSRKLVVCRRGDVRVKTYRVDHKQHTVEARQRVVQEEGKRARPEAEGSEWHTRH